MLLLPEGLLLPWLGCLVAVAQAPAEGSKASVRPRGRPGHFSVRAQRKVTRRNGLLDKPAPRRRGQGVSTRHPWLGRKTPHIHVRRPSGLDAVPWFQNDATATTRHRHRRR